MPRQKDGWIKFYSTVLDKNLSPIEFKIWAGLLLLANTPKSNSAGLVDMSLREITQRLNVSIGALQKAKEKFIAEERIEEVKVASKTRPMLGLQIINYVAYQGKGFVSPSEHSQGEIVSPNEQSPQKIISPNEQSPQKIISPSEHSRGEIVSPNEQSPQKIISPSEQIVSPSEQIVSPSEQIVSPNEQSLYHPVNNLTYGPVSENSEKTSSDENDKSTKNNKEYKEEEHAQRAQGNFTFLKEGGKKNFEGSENSQKTSSDENAQGNFTFLKEGRKKICAGLKKRRNYNSPVAGAEASAITWMLRQGYTVENILAAHDEMKKKVFWRDKMLSMQSLKNQIGEVIKTLIQEEEDGTKPKYATPWNTVSGD